MELCKNEFQLILFEEKNKLFIFSWYEATVQMTPAQYKRCLRNYIELVKLHKPINLIVDSVNFRFPISPAVQDWIDTEIFPVAYKSGLRRVGLVVAPELIPQLSIEQAMETQYASMFISRYFDSREEAYNWLVS